jgi:hypothetical protein
MSRDPTRHLGSYMRSVGQHLTTTPMTIKQAHAHVCIDEGYAAATLIRLRERKIATEVEGGFIRGPRWHDAASFYGWPR